MDLLLQSGFQYISKSSVVGGWVTGKRNFQRNSKSSVRKEQRRGTSEGRVKVQWVGVGEQGRGTSEGIVKVQLEGNREGEPPKEQ